MVCRVVVNVESEDYLGMQINRSTRKKFVRQRGVCVSQYCSGRSTHLTPPCSGWHVLCLSEAQFAPGQLNDPFKVAQEEYEYLVLNN